MTHAFLTALAFAVLTFKSCEDDKTATRQVAAMYTMSVSAPDSITVGQSIPFEVTCGTPTPCWEFERFDITQHEREYTIEVLAVYDGRPCVQVLGTMKASSSVLPKEKGTYTLHFRRAKELLLDKIVVVK